jgi:folate-binding protein YgfZ
MMDGNYPMEAGLNNAISFSKGCYVGQEVVAKATYVGGVSRLLMGLRINEDLIPAVGSEILDGEGNKIGVVTSAGFSPKWGQVIALGYVKRPFATAGVRCQVKRPNSKPAIALLVDRISGE